MPRAVLDDVLACNAAYARFLEALGGGSLQLEPGRMLSSPRLNVLKLLVGPLRERIANWNEVATVILDRAQRETVMDRDPVRRRVVEECLAAMPEWHAPRRDMPAPLLVTIDVRLGDLHARLFSTITTIGTAQDITLQELRIESFHPADAETERLLRAMAASAERSQERHPHQAYCSASERAPWPPPS